MAKIVSTEGGVTASTGPVAGPCTGQESTSGWLLSESGLCLSEPASDTRVTRGRIPSVSPHSP